MMKMCTQDAALFMTLRSVRRSERNIERNTQKGRLDMQAVTVILKSMSRIELESGLCKILQGKIVEGVFPCFCCYAAP